MSCHFIVMNMEKEWNKNDLGMLFEKRDIFIYFINDHRLVVLLIELWERVK